MNTSKSNQPNSIRTAIHNVTARTLLVEKLRDSPGLLREAFFVSCGGEDEGCNEFRFMLVEFRGNAVARLKSEGWELKHAVWTCPKCISRK